MSALRSEPAAGARPGTRGPTASRPSQRLASVDVLRGLTVALMAIVNAAGVLTRSHAEVRVFDTFLHAAWVGCTLADLVFPFFVFVVGVSIALALGPAGQGAHAMLHRLPGLARRTAWLVGIGLVLSLVVALPQPDVPFEVLGVLQRIGVAFFLGACLHLLCSRRVALGLATGLLLVHWALVAWVPVPGVGAPDPGVPGLNFASWVDPALLGREWVLRGAEPHPYDPEGIVSTLFGCVPQVLIGAAVGAWLLRPQATERRAGRLALAGAALAALGWLWGYSLPFVKSVWTSSYVLWTTGLAMLLLAGLHVRLDAGAPPRAAWVRFFQAFGVNALPAYVLHTLLLGIETTRLPVILYQGLDRFLPAPLASLPSILVVLLLTWLPVRWLQRRDIVLKV